MAPHCSTLAWKIPWTEEPGGLQSMGSRLSDFTFTFHFPALEKEMATHSSIFAWRVPLTAEPGGLPSLGSHRVGHDWSNLAAAAAVHVFTLYICVSTSALWIGSSVPFFYIPHICVAAAAAKVLQSCPTLCDPIDGSPPGSPIPGILQARTLEWVAISFSNALNWKVKVKSLSRVGLFATLWTAAYQAPPSMGSSRQEYWSGAPLPSHICANIQYFSLSELL